MFSDLATTCPEALDRCARYTALVKLINRKLERKSAVAVQQTRLDKLVLQLRPIITEQIGSRQTAIAADTDNVVDGMIDEVSGRLEATFALLEISTSCTTDDRAALAQPQNSETSWHIREIFKLKRLMN